jgi:hypothetical protein
MLNRWKDVRRLFLINMQVVRMVVPSILTFLCYEPTLAEGRRRPVSQPEIPELACLNLAATQP